MPTRNINLTEHLDRFVETGVTTGRYGNASEVVREGLRLLEQREQEDHAKLEWLRKAAQEGFDQIDRGEGVELRSRKNSTSTSINSEGKPRPNSRPSAIVPSARHPRRLPTRGSGALTSPQPPASLCCAGNPSTDNRPLRATSSLTPSMLVLGALSPSHKKLQSM